MAKRTLARRIAIDAGTTHAVAEFALDAVVNAMAEALVAGQRIEIRGFGGFRPRHYPPYEGRNPSTGQATHVQHKVLPVFRPGDALLALIQSP